MSASQRDGNGLPIRPILVNDVEGWLRVPAQKIRGYEYFNAIFWCVAIIFRIRTGNQYPAILEKNGLRMIQSINSRVCHYRHAIMQRLGGVIENRIAVGIYREAKAGATLLTAIENKICSVRKCSHTRDDSS